MKISLPPPIQNYPLSELLKIADKRMLSFAGQKTYDPFRIYLGTGHLVRENISRLLITTQLLFYFEKEKIRKMTMNDVTVPTAIHFNYLSQDQIDLIVECLDIHHDRKYHLENPFNFNYEFFGYYLDPSKNFNKILSAWSDIMINEWRVLHGFRLFIGFGYKKFAEELHNGEIPIELSGIQENELEMVEETGIHLVLLRGLWFANNIIIRLQALWDKMLTELLLKSYFSCNSTGKTLTARKNKLLCLIKRENLTFEQKIYLDKFILMSNSITELREWRDHDVHMVSEAIQGVYSRSSSDKELYQLWNRIRELHNITKEALFSLIGFMVSGQNYSPKYVLRVIGKGEQLENKCFNPKDSEERNMLIELQEIFIDGNFSDNVQRVMDILFHLWSIRIEPAFCRFKVFSTRKSNH